VATFSDQKPSLGQAGVDQNREECDRQG